MRSKFQTGACATLVLGLGVLAAVVVGGPSQAEMKVLEIGEPIPAFTMKDLDGKTHTLDQYDGKVVVFKFCTQQCPFSRGADPDINALAEEYAKKGVVFLGVESNKNLEPADIRPYINERGISYPILEDVDNTFADAVGAKVTPEIYIKGADGTLVYHGAPDNRPGPEEAPTEQYLRDALDAILAGEPIETAKVQAWGCGIKRAS